MNAIGALGNFLIENQLAIEIFLLLVLAGILLYWVFKQFVIQPKQDAAIEELISKIENLENKLQDAGVVEAKGPEAAESVSAEEPAAEEVATEVAAAEEAVPEVAADAEEVATPAKHGFVNDTDEKALIMKSILEQEMAEDITEDISNPNLEETIDFRELVVENTQDGEFSKPSVKFTSRNWGEDRHGNFYTEEMLKDQIS